MAVPSLPSKLPRHGPGDSPQVLLGVGRHPSLSAYTGSAPRPSVPSFRGENPRHTMTFVGNPVCRVPPRLRPRWGRHPPSECVVGARRGRGPSGVWRVSHCWVDSGRPSPSQTRVGAFPDHRSDWLRDGPRSGVPHRGRSRCQGEVLGHLLRRPGLGAACLRDPVELEG